MHFRVRQHTQFILAGVLLSSAGGAQNPDSRALAQQDRQATHDNFRYRVLETAAAPIIDGDLKDAAWVEAAVIDQFIQQDPIYGEHATESTEVRVLRGHDTLYISVYCRQSNPGDIVRNVLRFRDDSVWQKDDVVRIVLDTFHDHRRGYVFSINPLGTKQDSQVDNQTWNSDWDEVWNVKTQLQADGWSVELAVPFRVLRFPAGGNGTWGFNVVRSVKRKNETSSWAPIPAGQPMSRLEYHGHLEGMENIAPQRNLQIIPYSLGSWSRTTGHDSVTKGEIGGDLKYSLTSSLSLDVTYNTNFAQVEADDQQVNLTRFSLRFPEKREFFLENAQLFRFGADEFAEIFFSRRIGLANRQPVPLFGGARMTGRAGPFDLGVLSTDTEAHDGLPGTNFSAGRVRWNLGSRSYVGGILTAVASSLQRNVVAGPDAMIWLSRNWRAEGFLAVVNDPDQPQRKSGFSSAWIYNTDRFELNLRTLSVDEGFDPALGFVSRDDMRRQSAFIRRSVRLNQLWSRKLDFYTDFSYIASQQNVLETREREVGFSNEFESGDTIRLEWESALENIPVDEPFVIHPRRGIQVKDGVFRTDRFDSAFTGFAGRSLVPGVQFETGPWLSGRRTTLNLSNIWRASPHFLLEGDYEMNDVTLPEGSFVAHLWRGRVSVPITARMTSDAYLQWNSLEDTFSTQLRFHLIYARDSNLYVVFTDGRRGLETAGDAHDRALQVKLTYRFYQ